MQKGQKFEKLRRRSKKSLNLNFFSLKNFQIQTALKIHEISMFHKFYAKDWTRKSFTHQTNPNLLILLTGPLKKILFPQTNIHDNDDLRELSHIAEWCDLWTLPSYWLMFRLKLFLLQIVI